MYGVRRIQVVYRGIPVTDAGMDFPLSVFKDGKVGQLLRDMASSYCNRYLISGNERL
jgi:hypothetical protein